MKRIKSIDTFRGLCLFLMVWGHMLTWWVRSEDRWLTSAFLSIFGDIVGAGFLFVSGLSAVLFFKSRLIKAEASEDINIEHVNNEYLFRALLILIAALIFTSITAIGTLNPLNIWKWYIPLTIAISILLPYQGQIHVFGVLFHILYNSMGLHPILFYFSFFLIGTVVGDVIFEIYLIDNQKERRSQLKKKILLPLLTIGSILLLIAFLFLFPSFLLHATFSSTVYSLGTLFVSFSVLLIFEEYEIIKVEKSYRFFLFYSFYSFTIYFSHFILYIVFLNRLNAFNFWIAFFGTLTLLTLLIRIVYKKYGIKASLKVQIARISLVLVTRMEVKKKKKDRILLQSKT
ncbi:hypothetical protein ES703_80397 [subsurface metagenome]